MRRTLRTIALVGGGAAAGLALALGLEGGIGRSAVNADVLAPPPPVAITRAVPTDATQFQLSFAPVAKRAAPTVVNVYSAASTAAARR